MTATYRCGECGGAMRQELACVPYAECGLPDVMLHNVPVWTCDDGHRDLQVPAVDELHDVLAEAIITHPWRLRGKEVRFLRKHLGYTGRQLSALIGLNHVTLSRFENEHREIPQRMDALVRLFAAQALTERTGTAFPKPLISVLHKLESEGSTFSSGPIIERVGQIWQVAAAC